MKKQLRNLFAIVIFSAVSLTGKAQDFYFTPDSVITGPKEVSDYYDEMDLFIYFHNNTADTVLVAWKFLANTLTPGWDVGLCDNRACFYNVDNSLYVESESDPIPPYDSIFLKAVFNPRVITGGGTIDLAVKVIGKDEEAGKTNAILLEDTLYYQAEAIAVTGINGLKNGENISVFPSPTVADVFVRGLVPTVDYTIDVLDLQGRVLTTTNVVNKANTPVSSQQLAAGMYLLRISDEKSHTSAVHTFVKQ